MAKLRCVTNAGYDFSVSLSDPLDDYAAIAGSPTCTEIATAVYEINVGAVTGIVYVELTDGALRVVGYANCDVADDDGRSEVFDTLADAINALTLRNIKDAIGAGQAVVHSPVEEDGIIRVLTIGDLYASSYGRSLRWVVDKPTGFDCATGYCKFGLYLDDDNKSEVQGSTTDNNDGTLTAEVELQPSDTQGLTPELYDWTCAIYNASGEPMTMVRAKESRLVQLKPRRSA